MSRSWLDSFGGRNVLVTGHTGFKGSWLVSWLLQLDARVTGIALPPEDDRPSMFRLLDLQSRMDSHLVDIRDLNVMREVLARCQPEVVLHLAAQPLVRRSYEQPVDTYATNVMGTVHVLEAARRTPSVRSVVSVTSDKCYENRGWPWGYRESDAMGGHDPYSSSKGAAELVTAAYRRSYFHGPGSARVASARAGNAIGGGDWSKDRLIPDLVRAMELGTPMRLRDPHAVRPWQHVLEPLSGYLRLAAMLLDPDGERYADCWNFGPAEQSVVTVGELVEQLRAAWPGCPVELAKEPPPSGPHEAHVLRLDVSKARQELGWSPLLSIGEAVELTASWYQAYLAKPSSADRLAEVTQKQIADYVRRMHASS
jgi:CDP-glucose 4,6-dehydratase